ncbi:conserved Plasmodium protein, unknown function [Plasmodium chabaudi chabaudi]|uniref:ENTH domain-containing protein n=1 Tax=Plasmodium chabaudi chabaudi TaxID=31271 RepID=A0A4V0KBS1_PLACU|nr:conserved Plasmodium protein, unknown function [Plasmodium chabaudi chabaudi]VTZ70215.1 conserved Plasmodium protein, unknown function [Plasmodium chabaudi chabaudi]|eukprot:XP_741029.2 conserved Plasmodium protein, unknown function [Plasmodium chabaudi chabaudi]
MNRLILNKATSSNDEPTPGYLYNEISQMAFCSKESLNMVGEYLLKKLQRTDLNVKLKTLKILKHLCDKKRSDFRNFLKKKIDIIKECQNCNIVHDQLKGDTPSMLVRKEATDLIKIIYSYETVENNVKTIPNSNQDNIIKNNRIEGFGNNVFQKDLSNYPKENNANYMYNNSISGNNNNNFYDLQNMKQQVNGKNMSYQSNTTFSSPNNYANKMPGFGNPYFNQNPVQKTKSEIAIKYLNEVANKYIPSSFVNKINKVSTTISKNYSNGSLNFQNIIGGNSFNKNFEKGNAKYYDNRNPGWGSNNNNFNNYNNTKYYKNNKIKEKMRTIQESQESGLYENKIIDDVLNTTGINKVPCENIVNEFVQKCDTLDTKVIIGILTSKLKTNFVDEEANWKYKIKVLHVIKHLLIHRKNKKNNEQLIETFEILLHNLKRQTMEELYKCKEIKQLKKLAIEIFVLMGLKEKQPDEDTLKTVQRNDQNGNTQNPEIPNLLDFDDDPINITPTNNRHAPTNMFKDPNANKNFRDIDIDLINFENNSNNNQKNNQNNNRKKSDESFDTIIRNIDNMSLSKNTELFNSLNVKCASNSYNNAGTSASGNTINMTNEKCRDRNNSINSYGKANDNAFLNDLILLNPENDQKNVGNDNIIKPQDKRLNLNDGDDFFNLGSTSNTKNHKDSINSSKNTYLEDMEKIQFSKGSYNMDDKNKINKLNIETLENENAQFYDRNNSNNINEKNSNDACLIDINDNLTDMGIKKNNNVNTIYSDKKNVHNTKYNSDFLNNSINTNDDKINHFFNTFTISPKKPEKPNEKPNVKIDAFELMADKMKL